MHLLHQIGNRLIHTWQVMFSGRVVRANDHGVDQVPCSSFVSTELFLK